MNVTQKTCIVCNAKLTEKQQRAKYCSNACRVKDFRYKRQGEALHATSVGVTQIPGKHQPEETLHTDTDQAFIDDAAKRGLGENYYNFSKEIQDRQCIWCQKIFHTRLRLNKTCSPNCRDAMLHGLTR